MHGHRPVRPDLLRRQDGGAITMRGLTPWILIGLAYIFRDELLTVFTVIKTAWQLAGWLT